MFEIKRPVDKGPVVFGSVEKPGFTEFIIHGGECFDYDRVRGRRLFNLVCQVQIEVTNIMVPV